MSAVPQGFRAAYRCGTRSQTKGSEESVTVDPLRDPQSGKHRCPKCGHTKFSVHYHEAVAGWRFLWWKRAPKDECLMLWCLGCSAQHEVPVGSVQASDVSPLSGAR